MSSGTWARSRPWVLTLTIGLIACLGAFFAGEHVRSPWEDARENADTAVLASTAVVHGELIPPTPTLAAAVTLGTVQQVTVAESEREVRPIVTRQRLSPGDTVGSGTALVDVADRPIIALTLPFPLFRDLHAGDHGADVSAVQRTLAELKMYDGRKDGVFGPGTQAAVHRLYKSVGAVAPPTTAEDAAALKEAQDAYEILVARSAAPQVPDGPDPASEVPDGPIATKNVANGPDSDGLAAAGAVLAAARARAAGWLSSVEVIALSAGATVAAVAPVGTLVTENVPAMTLRSGSPTASGRASLSVVDAFPVGSQVVASRVGESQTVPGVVTAVGKFFEANGDIPPGHDIQVELTSSEGLDEGSQVIVSMADGGTAVTGLLVPVAAVREDGGVLSVLVLESAAGEVPARTRRVGVSVTVARDGLAIVDGDLEPGALVVVGA